MWKLQIDTSGVDVDGFTQDLGGHDRALDVPAGTSLAPGRVP